MIMKRRIAIIGAGASGICAAKHMLAAEGDVELIPVLFEQKKDIGGAWIYEDIVEGEEVMSSIYKDLKTNLPRQVMIFPDFPYADELPSFVGHTVVRNYLQSYAEHFHVKEHVRLNTKVVNVGPVLDGKQDPDWIGTRWMVKSHNLITGMTKKEEFDGMVLCNGHFTKPYIPTVKGIENFKKPILHTQSYRDANDYVGKTMLLLGFGPCARDICSQLTNKCKRIYVSHKGNRCKEWLPENIRELPELSHVNKDGLFIFKNGRAIDVDMFMYCTGFEYDVSFLDGKSEVEVHDRRAVFDLYKHIVFIKNPSICFIGLPWAITLFPLIHQQSAYLAALLTGKIKLPSKAEMEEDMEKNFEELSLAKRPIRNLHMFMVKQWSYNDMLASLSGCTKNRPIVKNLYQYSFSYLGENPLFTFKDMEFREIDDENFEHLNS